MVFHHLSSSLVNMTDREKRPSILQRMQHRCEVDDLQHLKRGHGSKNRWLVIVNGAIIDTGDSAWCTLKAWTYLAVRGPSTLPQAADLLCRLTVNDYTPFKDYRHVSENRQSRKPATI